MADRVDQQQPVSRCTEGTPLGLDAAARERVLAAGSFEAAFPAGLPATGLPVVPSQAGAGPPMGDPSLLGLVDRLFVRLEGAEATNRLLRAEVARAEDRARRTVLAVTVLCAVLVVGMFAVCLVMDRFREVAGMLR